VVDKNGEWKVKDAEFRGYVRSQIDNLVKNQDLLRVTLNDVLKKYEGELVSFRKSCAGTREVFDKRLDVINAELSFNRGVSKGKALIIGSAGGGVGGLLAAVIIWLLKLLL